MKGSVKGKFSFFVFPCFRLNSEPRAVKTVASPTPCPTPCNPQAETRPAYYVGYGVAKNAWPRPGKGSGFIVLLSRCLNQKAAALGWQGLRRKGKANAKVTSLQTRQELYAMHSLGQPSIFLRMSCLLGPSRRIQTQPTGKQECRCTYGKKGCRSNQFHGPPLECNASLQHSSLACTR